MILNIAYFVQGILGVNVRSKYSHTSDTTLDHRVSAYTQINKMIRCNSILAQLQASGTWLQHNRTRTALNRVDQLGVTLRWGTPVQ